MSVITNPSGLAAARQERRKLALWRLLAFTAFVAACLAIAWGAGAFKGLSGGAGPHIARVAIHGPIFDNRPLLKLLDDVGADENVQAVILDMNTPGGTTVGGEAIYEAVKTLGETKPVVTQVGTLAASAGYMIAVATDHIFVRRSSIIGSIGVIFTYANASELLQRIGVEVKDIKTGVLKAEPAPYSTPPAEVEPVLRQLIDDTYQWFVDVVAQGRDLPRDTVIALADGRVVSGSRGVELSLADAIGGEAEVVQWLEAEKGISADLEVLTWRVPADTGFGLFDLGAKVQKLLGAFGLDPQGDLSIATTSIFQALEPSLALDSDGQGGFNRQSGTGLRSVFRVGDTQATP
ncbi:MAG: signal peptide peptidase SppA [Pseudomonadota bacterium]